MADAFATIPLLFAQAAANGGTARGDDQAWVSLLPYLMIPFIFYFLLIRPQQQQDRKRKDLVSALKKNDRVLTSAGIYGTVLSVDNDQDRVVLRVDDDKGGRLTFTRSSIVRVLDAATDKDKDKEKDKEKTT